MKSTTVKTIAHKDMKEVYPMYAPDCIVFNEENILNDEENNNNIVQPFADKFIDLR